MLNKWNGYIEYLLTWAEEHDDLAFAGNSPVCYDEWLDNECEEETDGTDERSCVNPVYEAYKVLLDCKEGDETVAIEEAIGFLGEALA